MKPCGRAAGVRRRCRLQQGTTFVELIVAIVIVAILAAIAVPSYRQYLLRGNRAQAKQFLEDMANRQEQYFLDRKTYAAQIGSGGLGMAAPESTSGLYTFAIATNVDCLGQAFPMPGYTLAATATGSQSADGTLCLDSANQRVPSGKWAR